MLKTEVICEIKRIRTDRWQFAVCANTSDKNSGPPSLLVDGRMFFSFHRSPEVCERPKLPSLTKLKSLNADNLTYCKTSAAA